MANRIVCFLVVFLCLISYSQSYGDSRHMGGSMIHLIYTAANTRAHESLSEKVGQTIDQQWIHDNYFAAKTRIYPEGAKLDYLNVLFVDGSKWNVLPFNQVPAPLQSPTDFSKNAFVLHKHEGGMHMFILGFRTGSHSEGKYWQPLRNLSGFGKPVSQTEMFSPLKSFYQTNIKEPLLEAIKSKVLPNDKVRIISVGHSFGGSLSVISGHDMLETLKSQGYTNVTSMSFASGAPRVGPSGYLERLAASEGFDYRVLYNPQDSILSEPYQKPHPALQEFPAEKVVYAGMDSGGTRSGGYAYHDFGNHYLNMRTLSDDEYKKVGDAVKDLVLQSFCKP